MSFVNRREFLRASTLAALGAGLSSDLFAESGKASPVAGATWDAGTVRHLLPTVSDSRILVKASFSAPLSGVPTLRVGNVSVRGRMGDTRGGHWHFYATDLRPGRRYALSLSGSNGRALCQPWELATFSSAEYS